MTHVRSSRARLGKEIALALVLSSCNTSTTDKNERTPTRSFRSEFQLTEIRAAPDVSPYPVEMYLTGSYLVPGEFTLRIRVDTRNDWFFPWGSWTLTPTTSANTDAIKRLRSPYELSHGGTAPVEMRFSWDEEKGGYTTKSINLRNPEDPNLVLRPGSHTIRPECRVFEDEVELLLQHTDIPIVRHLSGPTFRLTIEAPPTQ